MSDGMKQGLSRERVGASATAGDVWAGPRARWVGVLCGCVALACTTEAVTESTEDVPDSTQTEDVPKTEDDTGSVAPTDTGVEPVDINPGGGQEVSFPGDGNTPDPECIPNPCTNPGLHCDGDMLKTWDAPGQCTIDADRQVVCTYPEPSLRDCAAEGKRCYEEKALCVDCLEDSDCGDGEECDPELRTCRTQCPVDLFEDNDTQDTASTMVVPSVTSGLSVCAFDTDWYALTLTEPATIRAWITTDFVGPGFALSIVSADGQESVGATADGVLTAHTALLPAGVHYVHVSNVLAGIPLFYTLHLEVGSGPACVPNPCVAPETAGCEGNSVVSYAAVGTCTDVDGVAQCEYQPEAPVDCGSAVCVAGACSPYRLPLPGELVISEIMASPDIGASGQWLEVTNVSTESVTLATVAVVVGEASVALQPYYVGPGDAVVIGRSAELETNGGAPVELVATLPSLPSGAGTVALRLDDMVLDAVELTSAFGAIAGASLALEPGAFTPSGNDAADAWCVTNLSYGTGGRGTPGQVNGPCSRTVGGCRLALRRDAAAEAIDELILLQSGDAVSATVEVTVPGLTELTPGFDATDPLVRVEFGFGINAKPDDEWAWEAAVPDTLFAGTDADLWQLPLGTTPVGVWSAAARVSGDGGQTWQYCDPDGGAFAGSTMLEVRANGCLPGVCPVPASRCSGNFLETFDESSVGCTSTLGAPKCSASPNVVTDCAADGKLCDPDTLKCRGCDGPDDCEAPFQACVAERCIAQCQDDPREDDDTVDAAALVTPGEAAGVLCAGDADHLGFALVPGDRLTLTVAITAGSGLTLEVRDPVGASALFAGLSTQGGEFTVDVPAGGAGLWVVRLTTPPGAQAAYTVTTSLSSNLCVADPCPSEVTTCVDDTTLEWRGLDACETLDSGRKCNYGAPLQQPCAAYCVDGACRPTRAPRAGELVLTEAHRDGDAWWVELVVRASNLAASSVELRDVTAGGALLGRFDLPALTVGTRLVVSSAAGVPASVVVLAKDAVPLPAAATVTLVAGDAVLDTVSWSFGLAQDVGVDGSRAEPTDNDAAAQLCVQTSQYLPSTFGTPGAANDPCPFTTVACRFQHPAEAEESPGASLPVFVRALVPGLTDTTTAVDADPYLRMRVEAGYGPAGSPPAQWSSWTPTTGTPGWNGAAAIPSPEPEVDEYTVTLTVPFTPGAFRMAGRISGDRGLTWTYCDLDATAGYTVGSAAVLTVVSPCPANACSTPKAPACEGKDRVEEEGPGSCALDAQNQPVCTYGVIRTTCTFACSAGACVVPAAASPGDLAISEFTRSGNSVTSVELRNDSTVAVNVAGSRFGTTTLPDDAWLPAGGRLSMGVGAEAVLLDAPIALAQGATALELRRPDGTLIAAAQLLGNGNWALSEDGGYDLPVRYCTATPTPGAANGPCPVTVGWCRLQYPLDYVATPGATTTIYGRVWIAGLTDTTPGVDVFAPLVAEVGYGAAGSMPDSATWTWSSASANPGWNGDQAVPTAEPDNDEYQGSVTWPMASGGRDFAFRFSGDGGATWVYCDREPGTADGYTPAAAGHVSLEIP